MNVYHLVAELRGEPRGGAVAGLDLDGDAVRPALLTHQGQVLPPPPPSEPPPRLPEPPVGARPPSPERRPPSGPSTQPPRRAWGNTLLSMLVIGALFLLGRFAPGDFLQHFTVFILACFVGWQVIWSVKPALHTPLMSVTNAISGIIVVGGVLQVGARLDAASVLGAVSVLVATVNVVGGFLVTGRMLRMFHRGGPGAAGPGGLAASPPAAPGAAVEAGR
jgi:NAD(P) transhydrogenase subunit alpha